MRIRIQAPIALLLAFAAVSLLPAVSSAQRSAPSKDAPSPDLAITYSYLRSNAPPAGCGCFSLNGGSVSFSIPIRHSQWAVAADSTVAHAGNISSTNNDLTLSTFTAGIRYRPGRIQGLFRPFAQALAGPAYASGSLVLAQELAGPNGNASLAANIGGGVDLRTGHRVSIRLVEADYLLTTFNNGSNNHQNNLRVSSGLVIRLGK
jgi:outer membrane immunogenic protein